MLGSEAELGVSWLSSDGWLVTVHFFGGRKGEVKETESSASAVDKTGAWGRLKLKQSMLLSEGLLRTGSLALWLDSTERAWKGAKRGMKSTEGEPVEWEVSGEQRESSKASEMRVSLAKVMAGEKGVKAAVSGCSE